MSKISFSSINQLNLPFIEKFEEIDNVRFLRFKGIIDWTSMPQILELRGMLKNHNDVNNHNVIIDFNLVSQIDSAAAAVLLIELSELKQNNKQLALINLSDEIKEVLNMFKTGMLFKMYSSEEAALASLNE